MNPATTTPSGVGSLLVFGGTSEITGEILTRLAARGLGSVVLLGRDLEGLEARSHAMRALGVSAETGHFDAEDPSSHGPLVDEVFAKWGPFDAVLVAFGVLGNQAEGEADEMKAVQVAQINFVGAISVCLPVARQLEAQGRGTLVILSTVAAARARLANYIYGSSKAGVDAFAQGLGHRLAAAGCRVLIVRPGFVIGRMTAGMTRAPFSSTAAVVAERTVDALLGTKEKVWVPGLLRPLMWVMRHLPDRIFRKIKR